MTDFGTNIFILINNFGPSRLSDAKPFALRCCSIAEDGSDVEGAIIGANQGSVSIANDEFLLFIYFESYINLTLDDKDNFTDVI